MSEAAVSLKPRVDVCSACGQPGERCECEWEIARECAECRAPLFADNEYQCQECFLCAECCECAPQGADEHSSDWRLTTDPTAMVRQAGLLLSVARARFMDADPDPLAEAMEECFGELDQLQELVVPLLGELSPIVDEDEGHTGLFLCERCNLVVGRGGVHECSADLNARLSERPA